MYRLGFELELGGVGRTNLKVSVSIVSYLPVVARRYTIVTVRLARQAVCESWIKVPVMEVNNCRSDV
jgi:hypothetical protein